MNPRGHLLDVLLHLEVAIFKIFYPTHQKMAEGRRVGLSSLGLFILVIKISIPKKLILLHKNVLTYSQQLLECSPEVLCGYTSEGPEVAEERS